MDEAVAAGAAGHFREDAGAKRLLHRLQQPLAGEVGDPLEDSQVELPSDHGRDGEDATALSRQAGNPLADHLAHALRDGKSRAGTLEATIGGEQVDELGEEERVALGLLKDRPHQVSRRAYTFAVLDEDSGRPVNVGKAYTGLTDAEIAEMTEHFLAKTVEDRGWARSVELDTVIEVAFDSIQHSNRHRSGYALRFPRIVRLRPDKPVAEIDTLTRVAELYERYFGERSEVALSEVADVRGPSEGPGLRGVKP